MLSAPMNYDRSCYLSLSLSISLSLTLSLPLSLSNTHFLSPCDFPLISPRQLQIVDLDLMKAHRLSFDNSSPFLKEKKSS